MKQKMLIAISAIVIIGASAFYFLRNDNCKDECCKPKITADSKQTSACGSCGKNSCDKNCSLNPNDSTDLKSLVPSCNLSSKEMTERKDFLQATMAKKIAKVEELETVYDLIFHEPVEYSKELLEFINFERGCCSNFSFALIFEPNNKATHLQMYGSKDIKEELKNGFIELGFLKH